MGKLQRKVIGKMLHGWNISAICQHLCTLSGVLTVFYGSKVGSGMERPEVLT